MFDEHLRHTHRIRLVLTLVAIAMCSEPLIAQSGTEALARPGTAVQLAPLVALSDHLIEGQPPDRIHFADIALEELVRNYADEVFAEDPENKQVENQRSGQRWRSNAYEYAEQLLEMRKQLRTVDDVIVVVDPGQVLRLIIAGRSVSIDAPRFGASPVLQQRIADRYCRIALCPDLSETPFNPETGRRKHLWGNWSFGARQPPLLETSTGLHFRFHDLRGLPERKAMCLELVEALDRAAQRLAWFHQRGLYVDWPQVHLAKLPGSGLGALVVNGAGDYLELDVAFRALPNKALSDWYRQRISGGTARHIFDKAEQIFPGSVLEENDP